MNSAARYRKRIEDKLTEAATDWRIEIHSPSLAPMIAGEVRQVLTVWVDEVPIHLTWDKSKYRNYILPNWHGDYDGKLHKLELEDLDGYLDDNGMNVLLCALEAEVFRNASPSLMFTDPLWELRSMTERDNDGKPTMDLTEAPVKLRLLRALGDDADEAANLSYLRRKSHHLTQRASLYCYDPWVFYYFTLAVFFGLATTLISILAGEGMLGFLSMVFGPALIGCLSVRDARKEHGSWRRREKSRVTFVLHDRFSRGSYTGG